MRYVFGSLLALMATHALAATKHEEPPRWGSISARVALMRIGPGKNFPAMWEYHRPELPVKIIETYHEKIKNGTVLWKRVTDPDGATGWMQANMVSDVRTAVVRGGDPRPMHETPNAAAPVIWRAEAGVVGRLSECAAGWCKFDVRGRSGYIETTAIWGGDAP